MPPRRRGGRKAGTRRPAPKTAKKVEKKSVVRSDDLSGKDLAIYKQLFTLFDTRKYRKGLKLSQQFLKHVPKQPDVISLRGGFLYHTGSIDAGLELAKSATTMEPSLHIPHHIYGLLLKEEGRFREAEKELIAASKKASTVNSSILGELASVRMQLGSYKAAKADFARLGDQLAYSAEGVAVNAIASNDIETAKRVLREEIGKATTDASYKEQINILKAAGTAGKCVSKATLGEIKDIDTKALALVSGGLDALRFESAPEIIGEYLERFPNDISVVSAALGLELLPFAADASSTFAHNLKNFLRVCTRNKLSRPDRQMEEALGLLPGKTPTSFFFRALPLLKDQAPTALHWFEARIATLNPRVPLLRIAHTVLAHASSQTAEVASEPLLDWFDTLSVAPPIRQFAALKPPLLEALARGCTTRGHKVLAAGFFRLLERPEEGVALLEDVEGADALFERVECLVASNNCEGALRELERVPKIDLSDRYPTTFASHFLARLGKAHDSLRERARHVPRGEVFTNACDMQDVNFLEQLGTGMIRNAGAAQLPFPFPIWDISGATLCTPLTVAGGIGVLAQALKAVTSAHSDASDFHRYLLRIKKPCDSLVLLRWLQSGPLERFEARHAALETCRVLLVEARTPFAHIFSTPARQDLWARGQEFAAVLGERSLEALEAEQKSARQGHWDKEAGREGRRREDPLMFEKFFCEDPFAAYSEFLVPVLESGKPDPVLAFFATLLALAKGPLHALGAARLPLLGKAAKTPPFPLQGDHDAVLAHALLLFAGALVLDSLEGVAEKTRETICARVASTIDGGAPTIEAAREQLRGVDPARLTPHVCAEWRIVRALFE